MPVAESANGRVEWAAAARPRRGEPAGGDVALVRNVRGGVLVAVIDGVGHGREAARVAELAADVVRGFSTHDLAALLRGCHEALRGTRGAAVSLAVVSDVSPTLTWVGVGNVEGALVRSSASHTPRPLWPAVGLLGCEIPDLRTATVRIERGDLLVVATDGARGAVAAPVNAAGRPAEIAKRLLDSHSRPSDDAVVVVARCLAT